MMDYVRARWNMIEGQLRPNGVTDRRLIRALADVPREKFVPAHRRKLAYIDEDLEIRAADAASPPRFLMEPMAFARLLLLADIRSSDLVLDVGCATGYSVAVMAQLADSVVGLESDSDLATAAEAALVDLEVANAAVVSRPLAEGYASQAPFDVIVLEGAVEVIPRALFDQLRDGGRLVAVAQEGPVGQATLYQAADGVVSSRVAFNVSVRPLPGFQRPPAFVF